MRIPTNSTFSKEISKQFKRIFHRDMTLGGLQDLQEEIDLINPVDTHLVNQVSKLRKANGKATSKIARTVRQEYSKGTNLVTETFCNKGKKEKIGLETTSS